MQTIACTDWDRSCTRRKHAGFLSLRKRSHSPVCRGPTRRQRLTPTMRRMTRPPSTIQPQLQVSEQREDCWLWCYKDRQESSQSRLSQKKSLRRWLFMRLLIFSHWPFSTWVLVCPYSRFRHRETLAQQPSRNVHIGANIEIYDVDKGKLARFGSWKQVVKRSTLSLNSMFALLAPFYVPRPSSPLQNTHKNWID